MAMSLEDREALRALEVRIRTILPEQYQDCYEDVQPASMGSAGLKYGSDGKVAWNEMWATFCDLAMAGGPPHKGTLLEPASPAEIDVHPDRYRQVVEEICRGAYMVTGFATNPSPNPGWVCVDCTSCGMADWLVRAIVMENVSARREGKALHLPAGPDYRIEKEIKNVVTCIAKTSHYWSGHLWLAQQEAIADLFEKMAAESPLIEPGPPDHGPQAHKQQVLRDKMAEAIHRLAGRRASDRQYCGWLGVECDDVPVAIWMMRALVVSNVLSRREGTVLFVPVNPASDPDGEAAVRSVIRIHSLATAREIS
jgi:sirohydrochlorin cobaltochelatase